MTATDRFPLSPDAVSADWLTDLLRDQQILNSDNEVADITFQKIDAGLASLAVRFDVSYSHGTDAPTVFFGKFLMEQLKLPEFAAQSRKEVLFYNQIHNPGINTPRCYYAAYDDENRWFILLEYLLTADWPDQLSSATVDQSRLVIKAMAAMHAKWWQNSKFSEIDWLRQENSEGQEDTSAIVQNGIARFSLEYGDGFPHLNHIGEIFARLLDAEPDLVNQRNSVKKATLLHGNFRLDNLCFSDGQVVLTDWQLVTCGNAIVDLTYWLCCNYQPTERRAQEKRILEQYSAELKKHGIRYTVRRLKKDIARILDIVLIVGFFVTLIVAWYHGDKGRQRVSGPELLLITGLFAIGGLGLGLLGNGDEPVNQSDATEKLTVTTNQEPWIAVLRFRAQTRDASVGVRDLSSDTAFMPTWLVLPVTPGNFASDGLRLFRFPRFIATSL